MSTPSQLSFHPTIPYLLVAGVGAGLVAFSIFSYAKTHREVRPATKLLLLFLRALAIAALLVCLLRPSLTTVEVLVEKGWMVLILDNSRSMMVRDLEGETSRAEAAWGALRQCDPLLRALTEQYRVERYFLGRETVAWENRDPDWSEKATAIGSALEHARLLASGKKVAGILLLSDGANNHGPEPVQAALGFRDLAAPLYVFGIGRETGFKVRDAKAASVLAPRKVFSGNQFPIESELHFFGMEGEKVEVLLRFDGNEVHRETHTLMSGYEVHSLRMMHREVLPGAHRVEISIPRVTGEISDKNNEASTFVEVLTGGINVLYLEGKLRPEFGFLRRTLESSQNLALTCPLPPAVGTPQRMEKFLKGEDISKYHVFLFGDLPVSLFAAEFLGNVRKLVGEGGAGILFLGGYDTLGPGGYGNSRLADLLPFQVSPQDGQVDQPTAVIPTEEGLLHFLMALESDPNQNAAVWSSMPPLLGLTEVGPAKPGARLLAVSEGRAPLVGVQEFGKGRVAAFLGDTTFRWVLGQPPESAARHKKFWRQIVLWLASRDKQAQKTLLLNLDKFSYSLGEPTRILAEVIDEKGSPIPDAEVRVTLELEGAGDKPAAVPAYFRGDHYEALYTALKEGTYKVIASATHQGNAMASKEARFSITVPDQEFDIPLANLKLLRNIAEASRGAYHPLHELESVLREIQDKNLSTEIRQEQHDDVWDTYPVFVLFVLPLLLEWVIRRKKGLV